MRISTIYNSVPSFWTLNDLDDTFETALTPLSLLSDRWMAPTFKETDFSQVSADMHETKNGYLLTLDLPGFKKEDLHLETSENILNVRGERKRERSFARVNQNFTLPSSADLTLIEASLEDGVLHIAIPKAEKARPRAIEVKNGKGGFLSKLIGSQSETEVSEEKSQNH